MRRILSSRWFALADLFLVLLSGLLWMLKPEIGVLPIIAIALSPWVVRILAGLTPFKNTPLDWLVAIFLITAGVGYWAAYDGSAAWGKVWSIILAVLLYYALAAQPEENFPWVGSVLFCIGVGVALYFFLTHDFNIHPRKVELVNQIGRWMMKTVPRAGWKPIHPNYVAGISAITAPFILYPTAKLAQKRNLLSNLALGVIAAGCILALLAVLMATSRGVYMAIFSAIGIWVMWRIVDANKSKLWLRREAVFPVLVFIFLCAVVIFLYIGPANSGSVYPNYYYGTGSRSELVKRGLYLLVALPFTGGGLDSFPGLYSYYMLGIPNFNVPNSHNLFLDVAIEQGLLAGLSIFIIFVASILYTIRSVLNAWSPQVRMMSWLTLFAIVIAFTHGMVDDYLYNGKGTMLLLFLCGLSMMLQSESVPLPNRLNYRIPSYAALIIISFFIINLQKVRSAWFADLGAVHMERVELAGFPTNRWADASILPELDLAKASLYAALQANPTNRTANYRLGLIALLQQDFDSAAVYLDRAKQEAPNHRGIIKSLGYCYVWLGDMEKAIPLLTQIPEAQTELEVYAWWWDVEGRPDLSEKASLALQSIETLTSQP